MAEEELHPLVLALGETVSLGMERRRHILLNPQFLGHSLGEVGHKSGVSIGDDFIWQAEPSIDMFEIQMGHALSGYGRGAWKEQCCSGAPMNDNGEDGVVALTFGERHNQVHCHHLEGKHFRRYWNFVEGDARPVCQGLILLAYRTPLDIICDPLVHPRPPVGLCYLTDGPVSARVSHLGGIVGCLQ